MARWSVSAVAHCDHTPSLASNRLHSNRLERGEDEAMRRAALCCAVRLLALGGPLAAPSRRRAESERRAAGVAVLGCSPRWPGVCSAVQCSAVQCSAVQCPAWSAPLRPARLAPITLCREPRRAEVAATATATAAAQCVRHSGTGVRACLSAHPTGVVEQWRTTAQRIASHRITAHHSA